MKKGRPKGSSLLKRYPQLPEASNDTASNERNMVALNKELEKEKPRKDVVLSLLNETFALHREEFSFQVTYHFLLQTRLYHYLML